LTGEGSDINRFVKYLTAATTPAFWPALARGVMPTVEHIPALKRLLPRTLIDVGANKGQFSLAARYLFPDIEVHAFEPLERERTIYEKVVTPAKLYATAVGRVAGEASFYVTSRADSSSLLQPGSLQKKAYGVSTKSLITVSVARLPDIIDLSNLSRPILLKIDVQGGELEVLQGAEAGLSLIDMIYCEVSFVQLYEGQPLANEITNYLSEQGFALKGIFNRSVTKDLGPTQADFLFMRASASQ
jgi:FkbM family methyltransferase